jgi:hypothetical protein
MPYVFTSSQKYGVRGIGFFYVCRAPRRGGWRSARGRSRSSRDRDSKAQKKGPSVKPSPDNLASGSDLVSGYLLREMRKIVAVIVASGDVVVLVPLLADDHSFRSGQPCVPCPDRGAERQVLSASGAS